jgi:hypothetical protein
MRLQVAGERTSRLGGILPGKRLVDLGDGQIAGGEPTKRRIEDDQIKCAIDVTEHVTVAYAMRSATPLRAPLSRAAASAWGLMSTATTPSEDGIDAAAGPHVQHPIGLSDLAENCLAQQLRHRHDRHYLAWRHQRPTEVAKRLVTTDTGA